MQTRCIHGCAHRCMSICFMRRQRAFARMQRRCFAQERSETVRGRASSSAKSKSRFDQTRFSERTCFRDSACMFDSSAAEYGQEPAQLMGARVLELCWQLSIEALRRSWNQRVARDVGIATVGRSGLHKAIVSRWCGKTRKQALVSPNRFAVAMRIPKQVCV